MPRSLGRKLFAQAEFRGYEGGVEGLNGFRGVEGLGGLLGLEDLGV